jgi:uncharacterized protein (TIGR02285 family)
MKLAIRLGAVLAAALVAPAASAQLPTVHWYVFNVPPVSITDGPRKGEGFLDLALQRQLLPRLVGYQHVIEHIPQQRVALQFTIQASACVVGMLRNAERDTQMLFSRPLLSQLPPGVLVRVQDGARMAPFVGMDGKLSLTRLLADPVLSVGMSSGRSYGAVIDALMAKYRGTPRLIVSSTAEPALSLLQMQMLGRVDVVPALPYELQHVAGGDPAMRAALRFYRLQEQPDFADAYVACAKGPAGEAIIRDVNAVLVQREVRDAVAAYYAAWLDDPSRALLARRPRRD